MLKKGASLDCSAKKGGNRLYCSVKCLYPGGGGGGNNTGKLRLEVRPLTLLSTIF